MNTESFQKEWKFLHQLLSRAEQSPIRDHRQINGLMKRINELKPLYSDMMRQAQAITITTTPEKTKDNHVAFSYFILSGSQRAAVLCDRVFEAWKSFKAFKRVPADTKLQDYRRIIETVVMNVLYAEATGKDGVRFSRDQQAYRSPSRYRPEIFNKRFLGVMDDLHTMQIIEQVKGDRYHRTAKDFFPEIQTDSKHYGLKQSFCVRGAKLPSFFTPTIFDANLITEGREIIIMKKGEGSSLLDYADDDPAYAEVPKLRRQMQIINTMLANAGNLLTNEGQLRFDQRQRFLIRRFTHSSLESGGRLWGGFWLNGMKRTERPTALRLAGEATVELDFDCMAVRLAYIVAEKPAPIGDQYIIPGLDPKSRAGIKKLLSALLFDACKERKKFPQGVAALLTPKDRAKGYAKVYQLIRSHHYELRAYLDRGLGHYLQVLESQLLINILIHVARRGMVALPIHDCLVVPVTQAGRMRGIMGRVVRDLFGPEASLPITLKTSEEREREAA